LWNFQNSCVKKGLWRNLHLFSDDKKFCIRDSSVFYQNSVAREGDHQRNWKPGLSRKMCGVLSGFTGSVFLHFYYTSNDNNTEQRNCP
jgi:hypothetical protein